MTGAPAEGESIDDLDELEAEAIYILREVAAQFDRSILLFSGGKDSTCLIHLARKAFFPSLIPFRVLHIDTGHNFEETLAFRDSVVAHYDGELVVRHVQDSIDRGTAIEETGPYASRDVLQTITLLEAIHELALQAAIGGGRRDEEKSRAKERVFSLRDACGRWDPASQRPELWTLLNGTLAPGEHVRAFPLSNWTELDIWRYVARESIDLPSLYFAHRRRCVRTTAGMLLAAAPCVVVRPDDPIEELQVRFRTLGDMTCSGAMLSSAATVADVIRELQQSRWGERGQRADDLRSDCALEDRKREGYF